MTRPSHPNPCSICETGITVEALDKISDADWTNTVRLLLAKLASTNPDPGVLAYVVGTMAAALCPPHAFVGRLLLREHTSGTDRSAS